MQEQTNLINVIKEKALQDLENEVYNMQLTVKELVESYNEYQTLPIHLINQIDKFNQNVFKDISNLRRNTVGRNSI